MRAGTRGERRDSRAEWRRRWRSVPYDDQKRVRAALRRGREVDDPALAPLAVEAAEHRLGGDESFAPPGLQRALATARPSSALVGASDLVLRRVERGRLRRAAEANRALAGPPRYPDEQT